MYYNRDPKGCGCVIIIYLIIFLVSPKIGLNEKVVLGIIFLSGILFFFIYGLYLAKKEESDEKKGKENNQNQQVSSYSSNYQKERLKFLTDEFRTLMSKQFPNKYLNSTDPFFDEFYTAIAKIKGYDFKCGREKENQLLEKIETHNAIIINKSKYNNQRETSKSEAKCSDFHLNLIYESIASEPLPDRYLSDDDDTILQNIEDEDISTIELYNVQEEVAQLISKRYNEHNENFIQRHSNDPIFNNVCGYSLDNEQRKAILCDSKHNLVIAGAGTGKTLTICGKIKYLLENNMAKEDEILLMSYSRDSVDDISKKVAKVSANMKAETFHALGLKILNEHLGKNKAIEDQIRSHIKAFFDERLASDTKLTKKIFKYFSSYLRSTTLDFQINEFGTEKNPKDWMSKKPYRTLKESLRNLNTNSKYNVTAKKEYVRSVEELVIANFLFVNGIEYEYEKPYEIDTATLEKRQYCPDFYLPKYKIYMEHYGIDKNGRARQYSYDEEQKYLESIDWKRETHKKNNTVCIETYSSEFSNGKIFTNLKKKLEEQGVEFKPLTTKQIQETVLDLYEGKDFSKFIDVLETFLDLYKSKYKDGSVLESLKNGWTGYERERRKIFFEIAKEIYDYYVSLLKENDKIDFDDMILQSTDLLDTPKFKNKYCYKYILVDEFQDISQSRFNFLKKLAEHGNSKLMVVGDDWQSIYRFNGSDINIFLDFKNKTFPDATINYITQTYRNSAELQKITGKFITKNPRQFAKQIKSDKHQENPVRIITYKNDEDSSGALEKALGEISTINPSAEVLILGRTNNDINKKFQSETNHAFQRLKISYKTIHASKGLESDFVILINAGNIPNRNADEPIINLLLGASEYFQFAEERRLFYVALTRTKSIIYILEQNKRPSVFVDEIKKDCCKIPFDENRQKQQNIYERTKEKQPEEKNVKKKMSLDEFIDSL